MEALAVAVIVIVLALCLGFQPIYILLLFAFVLGLMAFAALCLFLYTLCGIARAQVTDAFFVKIDKATKGRLSVAYYNVSDRTYPSVLPSEKLFKSKMYHTEKQCRVRLNRKRNCVYDKYAFATCIIGLLASVIITGAVIFLAYQVNSVQG